MESNLIQQLNSFGFTQNESKAYITLIKQFPATGYEISQRSGVPRSAIYDIMHRLELNGIVSPEGGKPVRYNPIPPDQLAIKLSSQFEHNIHELRTLFEEYNTNSIQENTWNIKGYQAMIDQARSLIDNSKESILCSIWNREYHEIESQLKKAVGRGIKTVCFSFTKIDNPVSTLFSYGLSEDDLREIWHRQIVMIVDKRIILLGSAEKSLENRSIWTNNPALRNIALNYIILDMTLYSQRQKVDIEPYPSYFMAEESKGLEDLLEKSEKE
ncbi:MAG: TrmB family transcriptional regulator [Candidatus Marinimicrobia bacterium]|jgi:sugar-specific transcriptional regulator TrmB|nr:TrmB family transcriptional regulator [Candidatus Neomarinimicrobiota bacterium]MBT3633312.1 TrmB family transcriptional regulator [Candidatus Neomarinimicrobiota bacterium]MBT3681455.1 TrmB family transcriptional regulator [Candidatus Neomarinimicrobiota bacterium]MBT3758578.1 TrmB family transcriptional regulator [Candidatus Neomarinimicrobiota bacterium]MBT3894768.1 TrmB family transcriptional regulator [Candidatus Neomarinimicrobiota bacterium]